MHIYTVRPRKDKRGVDLESDVLSHGRLWYEPESAAIGYAKWNSRIKGGKIEILDAAGQVIRTEEIPAGDFAY